MTTLTYANNTVMSYPASVDEFTGVNTNVVLPYWAGAYIYAMLIGSGGAGGLRKFNIDPDGTELIRKTATDIGVTSITASSGGAACLSYGGDQIAFISNAANVVQIAEIRTSDFTLIDTFGTAGSGLGLTQSDATHLINPDKFVGILNSGTSNLFTGGGGDPASEGEICQFPFTSFISNNRVGATTQKALFCLSLSSHNETTGVMYALASPWRPGVGGSGSLGLYSVTGGGITGVGTIAPSAIDAAWSTINTHVGLLLDETDGNVLVFFNTTDAVAHQNYLVKLNTSNAAIVWKLQVSAIPTYPWGMTFSRCKQQRFHLLRGTGTVDHINTNAGSITSTETLAGVNATGGLFISDDVTNSIIYYGGFNDAGGSNPNFVGAYMGSPGGHHTVSASWFRYWFATSGGGGSGNGGNRGGLTLSRKRAWTYTQDGHTFYVLDLSAEGTWVYDLETKQWSNFVTSGFTQWDVQAGVQWNSIRVVGGDLVTTDMWELRASSTQDQDGALDIPHIVTGGVQTRSRDFHSVEAFRLTGSSYKIGNPSSSVMNLRWSDDEGITWSGYYPITLTAGVPVEVQWRSLGAFDAPGRIFEVSDSGGMVRLDGADCFITDFDDDSPQQQG